MCHNCFFSLLTLVHVFALCSLALRLNWWCQSPKNIVNVICSISSLHRGFFGVFFCSSKINSNGLFICEYAGHSATWTRVERALNVCLIMRYFRCLDHCLHYYHRIYLWALSVRHAAIRIEFDFSFWRGSPVDIRRRVVRAINPFWNSPLSVPLNFFFKLSFVKMWTTKETKQNEMPKKQHAC